LSLGVSSAQATDYTLTVGQATTVTVAWPTLTVLHVEVPANQRLTLTEAPSATINAFGLHVYDETNGFPYLITHSFIGNGYGTAPFFDLDPATTLRKFQFQLTGSGDITLTANLQQDPAPQLVTLSTPTTATISTPGEQRRYTFQGIADHRLGVSVVSSALSPASDPVITVLSADGGTPANVTAQLPSDPILMRDTLYTVVIDATADAVGPVTFELTDVRDVTASLPVDTVTTVDVSSVWSHVRMPVSDVPGARFALQVLSSTLRHPDGGPGSMTATMQVVATQAIDSLGTIGGQPVTLYAGRLMTDTSPQILTLTNDGLSSGSLVVKLVAVPENPTVPAILGARTTVDLTVPTNSRSYSFTATAGQRFAVDLTQIAMTTSVYLFDPMVRVTLSDATGGATYVLGVEGWQTSASATFSTATAGTWVLRLEPIQNTTGTLTMNLRQLRTIVVPLTMGAVNAGTTTDPTDEIRFTYPGAPGAPLPVITLAASHLVDPNGATGGATMRFSQNGALLGSYLPADPSGASFQAPGDLDPTKPWQLVATMGAGTTGSLSFWLLTPTTTTTNVAAEATTTVTFRGVGDITNLVFTPVPGKRIVVETRTTVAGADLELFDQNGNSLGTTISPSSWEFAAATTSAPLTLAARLSSVTPFASTVDIVIHLVSDPVITAKGATPVSWTLGQNPRLTFKGEKGKRVTLTTTSSSPWAPPWGTVTETLLSPTGQAMSSLGGTQGGSTTFFDAATPLPSGGVYTVQFDPDGETLGSLTASIRLVTDIKRPAILGVATALTFTDPGQQALLTIKVPAGKQLGWSANSEIITPVLSVMMPDGSELSGGQVTSPGASSGIFYTGPLAAGTYMVRIDLPDTQTGAMKLTLKTF
jgi:hypothetical protein